MKLCPNCGRDDDHHPWTCPLWPGTDGEWHSSLHSDSYQREPKIGHWWTFCCKLDLEEIKSEIDFTVISNCRRYGEARVWETLEEAIEELNLDEELDNENY